MVDKNAVGLPVSVRAFRGLGKRYGVQGTTRSVSITLLMHEPNWASQNAVCRILDGEFFKDFGGLSGSKYRFCLQGLSAGASAPPAPAQ